MVPTLVVHADWSTNASKRWRAVASWTGSEYSVSPPEQVPDPETLVPSSLQMGNGGPVVLGFDFPIGLPAGYAARAGIANFLETLPQLGSGRWERFYDLASRADEISLERPFYPLRPGGTRRAHLVEGLGLDSPQDLLRECDKKNAVRGNACPIFWTLGGNQVGRAAIVGWREVLVPAIGSLQKQLGVWPFDGQLASLIASRACVIAETYPADACVQLGLSAPGRGWSKRKRDDRHVQGETLIRWASGKRVDLRALEGALRAGFDHPQGDDQFDAVVGLLGMLNVILGYGSEGRPLVQASSVVEGWILGHDRGAVT